MKKRKIRGHNRRIKKIDNWVANNKNLDLEYLQNYQKRDFFCPVYQELLNLVFKNVD